MYLKRKTKDYKWREREKSGIMREKTKDYKWREKRKKGEEFNLSI